MKKNLKSWKTTIVGIIIAVAGVSHQLAALVDDDPTTVFDLKILLVALGLGGIGVLAKDGDKSTEDVK